MKVKVLQEARARGHKGNLSKMAFPFLVAVVDLEDVITDEHCKRLIQHRADTEPHYMTQSQPDKKRVLYPWSEMGGDTRTTLETIRSHVCDRLNLPDKYDDGPSSLMCTLPGANNQRWHQDVAGHVFNEKKKKDHGLSVMVAVNEARSIDFRIAKDCPPTRFEVRPRHALVFRSSLCHRGCGSAADDEFKLAVHFYLDPNNEPNLGAKTFGCRVELKKLYPRQLHSFQHFNNRTDGRCKPTLENGKGNNELSGISLKQMRCQLCPKLLDLESSGAMVDLAYCNRCKVVLCDDVCWQFFHEGLGLPNSRDNCRQSKRLMEKAAKYPTIEDFKAAKCCDLSKCKFKDVYC